MVRVSGHVEHCAEAVVTRVEDCECACAGAFHGGPHTWRARALLVEGDSAARGRYSGSQVRAARTKVRNADQGEQSTRGTELLATIIVDGVVRLDDAVEASRVEEGITLLVRPFADAIASSALTVDERERFKLVLPELHLLCTLCALTLSTKKALKDLTDQAVDDIVEQTLRSLPEGVLPEPIVTVVRIALKQACSQWVEWAFAPVNEKALQVLGVVFCPNTENHPEVIELCVVPLEGDLVNATIVNWAKELYPRDRSFIFARATAPLRL